MDGGMFDGGNVEGRLQEALNALGYLRRVSDGAMASDQTGGLSYDVPHRWTHAATGGGGTFEDTTLAAWLVRRVDETGADGSVTTKWQMWSPVWAAKHTLDETGAYLPVGMSADAWNDLPEGVAPSDGESLWAVLKIGVDCNDYSVIVGGEGATTLLALNGTDAGALTDTEVVPPQGTTSGTNGVYHIKVRIGEWKDEATAEEKAQGIVRLAFRQRHLGVIVESWSPVRKTQGTTLVTGITKTETDDGAKLTVSRSEFPIPPAATVLEDVEIELPTGGGSGLPEGTILYGQMHLEEVKDGSTSSGGKVTGYKLTQDKLEWRDGALAETEDSPVEIGTISLPTVPEGFTFVESVSYTNNSLCQTRKRWDGSEIVDEGQQVIATAQSATINTYRFQWDSNNVLRQYPLAITINALLGSVTTTSGMDEAVFGVTEHPANESTPYAEDTSGIVEESDEV